MRTFRGRHRQKQEGRESLKTGKDRERETEIGRQKNRKRETKEGIGETQRKAK